jgi:hypothetical protein
MILVTEDNRSNSTAAEFVETLQIKKRMKIRK